MTRAVKLLAIIACVLLSGGDLWAAQEQFDVAVIGAGSGGVAAAVQAARSGMRVAVVEASRWVGGQMTGAAVSTLDDLGMTRYGIYGEFIERVRSYYKRIGVETAICLWGDDTIALEPRVGREILLEMMREAGAITLLLETETVSADVLGGKVRSVLLRDAAGGERTISAHVFIDATEHGDFLPLAGAAYRVGNSRSDEGVDLDANVQDITYVAVVRAYDSLPHELRLKRKPPGYERCVEKFRSTVTVSGDRWPGRYPFDVPSHSAYRALPDPGNRAPIRGGDPETWRLITKTCINWANDYPGRGGTRPGLSARYVEDRAFRAEAEREAMLLTLSFIWYMQNELGMKNWSVDDSQGFGGRFSNDWENDERLKSFAPILRHFPPFPYVRESRRIIGSKTMTRSDIARDPSRLRAIQNDPQAVALGEYPVDVHGSHLDRYMEHELGESSESFPRTWEGRQGVFQVPFGVLIPENIDGLIAAEKNISVSRMVGGAIRLQPITMHTGQAAGAIASCAVKRGTEARGVDILSVQRALMVSGVRLALDMGADTSFGDPYWMGMQWVSLTQSLDRFSRTRWGVNIPIRRHELLSLAEAAFPGHAARFDELLPAGKWVTRRDFRTVLHEMGRRIPPGAHIDPAEARFLERGEAANVFFEILTEEKP